MDRKQAPQPVGLFGYTGQPATVILVDGTELSAAEIVGLAFKHYQAYTVGDADPTAKNVPTPDDWNGLAEATRANWCKVAVDELNNAQKASAALIDVTNVLGVVGDIADKQLGAALIDAALTEVKNQQRPWQQMTEDEQRDVLDRITSQVKAAVADTIRLLATSGANHIVCELEQITVKKGAKAVLVIPKGTDLDQHLLDAVGQPVILVIGPELKAAGDIQAPRPDPNQQPLPIGNGDDGLVTHSDPED